MSLSIKRFQGYSSKQDDIIDNSAVGQECLNMIVNEGALCNLPYAAAAHTWAGTNEKIALYFKITDGRVWCLFVENRVAYLGRFKLNTDRTFNLTPVFDLVHTIGNIPTHLNYPDNGTSEQFRLAAGKFYAFNNQVYYGMDGASERMPWYSIDIDNGNLVTSRWIGIKKPSSVIVTDTGVGSTDNTYDVAVTLATGDGAYEENLGAAISWTDYLHPNDIESNATAYGTEVALTGRTSTVKAYLDVDFDINRLEPTAQLRMGIYARATNQSFYYFVRYMPVTPVYEGSTNSWYVEVSDQNYVAAVQNLNKTAPFFEHSVPRNFVHGTLFKNRFYSFVAGYSQFGEEANYLQASPNALDEIARSSLIGNLDVNVADILNIIPNYVDDSVSNPVGVESEPGSGTCLYLGQLIALKYDSTHVLTDDIKSGSFRKLFDRGCVCKIGGDGYKVIDDRLYFISKGGIYCWNGQTLRKISIPIQHDLDRIEKPRYEKGRISSDTRYGLMFVSFPRTVNTQQTEATYVYHYNEGTEDYPDVWTRVDYIYECQEVDQNYCYTRIAQMEVAGKLGDSAFNTANGRDASWTSGKFTSPNANRTKHFKNVQVDREYIDGTLAPVVLSAVGDDQTRIVQTTVTGTSGVSFLHIGMQTKAVSITVTADTSDPFRINQMVVEAVLRGRR